MGFVASAQKYASIMDVDLTVDDDGLVSRYSGADAMDTDGNDGDGEYEFELDEETLQAMRENERRIIQEKLQAVTVQAVASRTVQSDLTTVVRVTIRGVTSEDIVADDAVVRVDFAVVQVVLPRPLLQQIADQNTMRDDDDDDDDDDDSDSDGDDTPPLKLMRTADVIDTAKLHAFMTADAVTDGAADDEDDETMNGGPLRTKNELPPDAVPAVEPFTVQSTDAVAPCGTFEYEVDGRLVVRCDPNVRTLDIGTAVCCNERTPLGRIDEVFGPINEAFYLIRTINDVKAEKIALNQGNTVHYVIHLAVYAVTDTKPGSDASNPHDEEVDADLQDFSDDEAEAAAKARKKMNKMNTQTAARVHQTNPNQPMRNPERNHGAQNKVANPMTQQQPQQTLVQQRPQQTPTPQSWQQPAQPTYGATQSQYPYYPYANMYAVPFSPYQSTPQMMPYGNAQYPYAYYPYQYAQQYPQQYAYPQPHQPALNTPPPATNTQFPSAPASSSLPSPSPSPS